MANIGNSLDECLSFDRHKSFLAVRLILSYNNSNNNNKLFKDNAKQFYRELGKKQIDVNDPPTLDEIEDFWSRIWENEESHNEVAEWIKEQEEKYKDQQRREMTAITTDDIRMAIKNSNNWTSPG